VRSSLSVAAISASKSCRDDSGADGAVFAADFFFPMVTELLVDTRVLTVDRWQLTVDSEMKAEVPK
jgi:hypothetical protein